MIAEVDARALKGHDFSRAAASRKMKGALASGGNNV
jgi:hypothetical protein